MQRSGGFLAVLWFFRRHLRRRFRRFFSWLVCIRIEYTVGKGGRLGRAGGKTCVYKTQNAFFSGYVGIYILSLCLYCKKCIPTYINLLGSPWVCGYAVLSSVCFLTHTQHTHNIPTLIYSVGMQRCPYIKAFRGAYPHTH